MVGRSVLVGVIAAITITAVLTIVLVINADSPTTKPASVMIQTPKTDHITITPKFYNGEVWADGGGTEGDPPKRVSISSTTQLDFCPTGNTPMAVSVPGRYDDNPIILKRDGEEVAIQFCLKGIDRVARTWELMPRDTRLDLNHGGSFEDMFTSPAISDGVKVAFDKTAVTLPAFPSDPNNPQFSSGNFTVFLSADQNTKLGDMGFYVLALRHLDDQDQAVSETMHVRDFPLHLRIVD